MKTNLYLRGRYLTAESINDTNTTTRDTHSPMTSHTNISGGYTNVVNGTNNSTSGGVNAIVELIPVNITINVTTNVTFNVTVNVTVNITEKVVIRDYNISEVQRVMGVHRDFIEIQGESVE